MYWQALQLLLCRTFAQVLSCTHQTSDSTQRSMRSTRACRHGRMRNRLSFSTNIRPRVVCPRPQQVQCVSFAAVAHASTIQGLPEFLEGLNYDEKGLIAVIVQVFFGPGPSPPSQDTLDVQCVGLGFDSILCACVCRLALCRVGQKASHGWSSTRWGACRM